MTPIFIILLLGAIALCLTVSPTLKGITTIKWGSGASMGTPSTALVQSGRITPKNGMPVEIEDNNGFTAALVFLPDGFDAEVTMMYDTALTWPGQSDTVVLTLPKWGAAGGTQAFNCFVAADPSIDIERKREATISYKLIYRPNCRRLNS
jgi:hypothetical protein